MTMPPPKAEPIKVLLVDDHTIIREGLRLLLGSHLAVKVVGEAGNIAEACAAAEREQPDIVLLDLDLGGYDGLDALPKLRAAAPGMRALILTAANDQETRSRAMRVGAMGLVSKDEVAAALFKAIEKVHGGEVWFDRATMGAVLSEMSLGDNGNADPDARKIASLTVREREVIALLCEGRTNRQVGEALFISETTVRHHLTSIFGKLEIKGRLPLLLYAFSRGLAQPPTKEKKKN